MTARQIAQLLFLPAGLLLQGCFIVHGDRWPAGSGKIVLTFDDGPNLRDDVSVRLLEVLKQHQVPATFCYVGVNADGAPAIVRRAAAEGHTLALHGYSHRPATLLTAGWLRDDLAKNRTALREALGPEAPLPTLYRPPFGLVTPAVRRVVEEQDLAIAHLTFFVYDPQTEAKGAGALMEELKEELREHGGGAIVLHEMRFNGRARDVEKSWLPEAAEELIIWARAEGFEFATYEDAPNWAAAR